MMPILTRFLSPEDYGIVAMYLFALGIAAPFLGNNLSLLALKKASSLEKKDLSTFIWTGFTLVGIISLVVFLVSQLPFLRPLISEAIFLPENWIWVVLIGAASQNITTTLLTYFQAKTQPLRYAIFQVGQSILIVILSLSLVAGFDMHWQGRVIAIAASLFLFAIIALICFLKILDFSAPSKKVSLEIVSSGVPLILHSLGFIIMSMVDRYLVSKLVGIGPAGVYMVAVQFASVMYMVGDGLYKATSPWVFQKLSDQGADSSRVLKINLAKVSGVIFLIAGLWAFVAPYAIEIFAGKDFHDAGDIVRPLIFAWTFYAVQQQFSNFFYHANRTLTLGLISGGITIFNVVITYIFIAKWGLPAAPYATLISFCIWALLTLFLGVRKKSHRS